MLYNNNSAEKVLYRAGVTSGEVRTMLANNPGKYTAEYDHTSYGTKEYTIDENTEVIWMASNSLEPGLYYYDSVIIGPVGIHDWDENTSCLDLIERDGKIVNGKISGSHTFSTNREYGIGSSGQYTIQTPINPIEGTFGNLNKVYGGAGSYGFPTDYYILSIKDFIPSGLIDNLRANSWNEYNNMLRIGSSTYINDVIASTPLTYSVETTDIVLRRLFVMYSYLRADIDLYNVYLITEHKADNRLLNARKTITVTEYDQMRFGSYSNLVKFNDEDFYRYWDFIPNKQAIDIRGDLKRYSTTNVVWDDEEAVELGTYYAPVAQYRLYDLLYQNTSNHTLINKYTTYFEYTSDNKGLVPKYYYYTIAIVNKADYANKISRKLYNTSINLADISLATINNNSDSIQIGSVYLKKDVSGTKITELRTNTVTSSHQWGVINGETFGWDSTGETFGNMTGIQVDVYNTNNPITIYSIYKKDTYYKPLTIPIEITVSSVHYDSTGKPIGIDKDNTNKRDNFLRSK